MELRIYTFIHTYIESQSGIACQKQSFCVGKKNSKSIKQKILEDAKRITGLGLKKKHLWFSST